MSFGSSAVGEGGWWTFSKADSRWNMSGRAWGLFGAQAAINQAVHDKRVALGEEPPVDLEVGFVKD